MRTLINYIRSCFCKHDWEMIYNIKRYENSFSKLSYKHTAMYRCKKCGYAKKYNIK